MLDSREPALKASTLVNLAGQPSLASALTKRQVGFQTVGQPTRFGAGIRLLVGKVHFLAGFISLAAKLDQLSRESGLSKRYLLEHALAQYLAKHSAAVVPSAV